MLPLQVLLLKLQSFMSIQECALVGRLVDIDLLLIIVDLCVYNIHLFLRLFSEHYLFTANVTLMSRGDSDGRAKFLIRLG